MAALFTFTQASKTSACQQINNRWSPVTCLEKWVLVKEFKRKK